jgi:hypothetical protein
MSGALIILIQNRKERRLIQQKIHFEYNKGERKKILYTLQPDNFLSGMYTMQGLSKWSIVGETTKQLN